MKMYRVELTGTVQPDWLFDKLSAEQQKKQQ